MSRKSTTEIALEPIIPDSRPNNLVAGAETYLEDPHGAFSLQPENERRELSKGRSVAIITNLSGVMVMQSISSGLLTVGLPTIAKDVHLASNLLLWPASVYPLTTGCLLILAGSIADVVGSRAVFLTGCFLQGVFVLACGLAKTGIQLIIFRAMQGVAVALALPTAVSIINNTFPPGRRRNLGLAGMGAGQCLGFCIGLVLGGLFVDTIGWRAGYYMCAAAMVIFAMVSWWSIPGDSAKRVPWQKLRDDIDWVGAGIASSCLGMFSYVLATVTASASNLTHPANISLFALSLALIPAFVFWVARQEKRSKPALIPNTIWRNKAFTSICLMMLLSWSVINVMEYFSSLFFQEVQHLSALQTSLRFLPSIISGGILNICTGLFAHKFRADYLVLAFTLLSAGAPLLMALINPSWPYWYSAFWVMLIAPLSADVLFTVAALVVTSAFPDRMQALGGAVFQTIAQFGTSFGLAIMASISSSVTEHSGYGIKSSPQALMEGYRVTFWVSFGWILLACAIGAVGLRKVGKVGMKRE